mgnify:CR=1 FL=1
MNGQVPGLRSLAHASHRRQGMVAVRGDTVKQVRIHVLLPERRPSRDATKRSRFVVVARIENKSGVFPRAMVAHHRGGRKRVHQSRIQRRFLYLAQGYNLEAVGRFVPDRDPSLHRDPDTVFVCIVTDDLGSGQAA